MTPIRPIRPRDKRAANPFLEFRDPEKAQALGHAIEKLCYEIGREVYIMHVCGTHEQSIARFGLRSLLPKNLNVIMGPGCPVCVTDAPEIDEAVALAQQGVTIATFGDMVRVPGSVKSLDQAKAQGADVKVVYSPAEAVELAQKTQKETVFFASGFETTAVATAAVILSNPPKNFSVLCVHKYVPPAMEIVAQVPNTKIEGFLAAGHAAIITGWKVFEGFAERHKIPVAVAGFEPLDILAALAQLLGLIRDKKAVVVNAYPRCVTAEGNLQAQKLLWEAFEMQGGNWRGITHIPNGNLRIRAKYGHLDSRKRFTIDLNKLKRETASRPFPSGCICGSIMTGLKTPKDCRLFGKECVPENPVGACMVSSEGACQIWHEYGGHIT
ncbi:MAG: hydrogenase formation protein HypD [Elusimicrobia bacterium]|nr:hydrogenase formation protein HypD [Elusimicrobiota bacterium]